MAAPAPPVIAPMIGALLAADQAAENRATNCAPRSSDFVSMLMPDVPVLTVVVVGVVTVILIDAVAIDTFRYLVSRL